MARGNGQCGKLGRRSQRGGEPPFQGDCWATLQRGHDLKDSTRMMLSDTARAVISTVRLIGSSALNSSWRWHRASTIAGVVRTR
jgi:hypothetical protein